jgi:hypothetical protein
VIKSKSKAIDLQMYDIEKMFDKINLKEAINDLWDYGLRNDNLVMLYLLNKDNKAVIRTPVGDTEKIDLDENVLLVKGAVPGSIGSFVKVTPSIKDGAKLSLEPIIDEVIDAVPETEESVEITAENATPEESKENQNTEADKASDVSDASTEVATEEPKEAQAPEEAVKEETKEVKATEEAVKEETKAAEEKVETKKEDKKE